VSHRRATTIKTLCPDVEQAGLKITRTGGVFKKTLSTLQIDWFLKNGLWEDGGFGWGSIGGEQKYWKAEFCRAAYKLGKQQLEGCNIIYACVTK